MLSEYKDRTGRTLPCYELTKNGIMLSDTFFYDVNADKYYYLTPTGAMSVDSTYKDTFIGVVYKSLSDGHLECI